MLWEPHGCWLAASIFNDNYGDCLLLNIKYTLHIKNVVYINIMNTKSIKFIELANKRVNKTIKDIQLIGNLANKQNYDYTEQQAKKIIKALQQELDEVKQSFANTNTSTKKTFVLDEPE